MKLSYISQFYGNFHSKKKPSCRKIESVFRDVKCWFNASWGLKRLIASAYIWHYISDIFPERRTNATRGPCCGDVKWFFQTLKSQCHYVKEKEGNSTDKIRRSKCTRSIQIYGRHIPWSTSGISAWCIIVRLSAACCTLVQYGTT